MKLDCEGCEWRALPQLAKAMPFFWASVKLLYLEVHYGEITPSVVSVKDSSEFVRLIRDHFALMFHSSNMATSQDAHDRKPAIHPALIDAGVPGFGCCHEMALVRNSYVQQIKSSRKHYLT
mmetsp:Transcript_20393/g.28327  ORF Transcript_20393/g.28327 Transcript_20393/m.28327 type:complete len:121 (+) Transcript_20393:1-363(+)